MASVVAPWALVAMGEYLADVREVPGPGSNPRILHYFEALGLQPFDGDDTPWCAAGAGWCLETAGAASTRKPNARSYLAWGESCPIRRGAIAVLWRGAPNGWQGHVGFVIDWTADRVLILGGNQGDAWSLQWYPRSRLLDCRWPLAA